MYLIVSFAFFAVFFANVVWAAQGGQPFFSDVQELLLLLTSTLLFVVGIIRSKSRNR